MMRRFALLVLALAVMGGCSSSKKTTVQASAPVTRETPAPIVPAARQDTNRTEQPAVEAPRFGTIYFDYDQSFIRDDQRTAMNANAELLFRNQQLSVVLEGHCDERGTDEYNLALGQRRADAVRQFLIDYGIPAQRINTVSYGEQRPAVDGANESAWSKNRRCEFTVSGEQDIEQVIIAMIQKKKGRHGPFFILVGVEGFEPPTSCSQSKRASRAALHPVRMQIYGIPHSSVKLKAWGHAVSCFQLAEMCGITR